MAGGLMQLVAYGAQDVYLTGNPKVTFFQAVYKRHTNFAMELIQQTVSGTPGNSTRLSVTIARNGDLIGNMHVALQPIVPVNITTGAAPSTTTLLLTSTNDKYDACWVAERAIAGLELTIGGQRIDKHYQTWWRLYAELFLNESDKYAWGRMTSQGNPNPTQTSIPKVYLPLLFFFNRNPGLYLPLIALQYHEVRLDFDTTAYYNSYFSGSAFEVWGNYVYLDTEERRRFAQKGHEYLIEQLQHNGGDALTSTTNSEGNVQLIRVAFNHPVKELVWCYQNPTSAAQGTTQLNGMWNFSTGTSNVNMTVDPLKLSVTGNMILPHLTGVPHIYTPSSGINLLNGPGLPTTSNLTSTVVATPLNINLGPFQIVNSNIVVSNVLSGNAFWIEEGTQLVGGNQLNGATGLYGNTYTGFEVGPLHQFKVVLNGQDRFKEQLGKYFNSVQPYYHHTGTPYVGIYVYSFALQPEEHQPTGTCNFSRIDNAQVWVQLKSNSQATTQKLFAINYNVLRIQSGMGGLAFSN